MKNLNIKEYIYYLIIFIFSGLLIGFFYYVGPICGTDTFNYLQMASNVNNGLFPHSQTLSPGYPIFLGITSKIFSIGLANSLYLWTFILIFFSFVLLHKIINLINTRNNYLSINSFFLVFIVISNWVIVHILIIAHADALFLVFLLLFFYFFYLWFISKEIKWFIITTVIGCISLWIKLNGLVLIPFLIASYFIYNDKKLKIGYALFPIVGMFLSFSLFKKLNGTVISHLNTTSYDKIITAIENYNLFFTNFTRSGNVYFSAFFSKSLALLVPFWFSFFLMTVLLLLFFRYFIFYKNIMKQENVFLLFAFIYWLFLFLLQQYIGFEEISARTLFPSILSLFLWIICIFKTQKKIIINIILGVVILNLFYSFYYVLKLYKSDSYDTFSYITQIENRKSVIQFKKLQKIYNFNDKIYTNQYRSLYYTLNFSNINNFPTQIISEKGNRRKLSSLEFTEKYYKFCKEFNSNESVLLLFDYPNLNKLDSCLLNKKTRIYRIENDIILLNL